MTHEKINLAFEQFAILLEQRFANDVYTTEDSVRYMLFHCLTSYLDLNPADFIIEYSHSQILRAHIDMYILPKNEVPGLAFEFKYDRKIPSEMSINKTQRAGYAFADIFRLATFKSPYENLMRYFIYLTDREMAVYFQNPSNCLRDFFELDLGKHLSINREYVENHPKTFIKAAGKLIVPCGVTARFKKDFDQERWLRIYEIIYKGEKDE